jgi:hypothetical protein
MLFLRNLTTCWRILQYAYHLPTAVAGAGSPLPIWRGRGPVSAPYREARCSSSSSSRSSTPVRISHFSPPIPPSEWWSDPAPVSRLHPWAPEKGVCLPPPTALKRPDRLVLGPAAGQGRPDRLQCQGYSSRSLRQAPFILNLVVFMESA